MSASTGTLCRSLACSMCPLARKACLSQSSLSIEVGVVVYFMALLCLLSHRCLWNFSPHPVSSTPVLREVVEHFSISPFRDRGTQMFSLLCQPQGKWRHQAQSASVALEHKSLSVVLLLSKPLSEAPLHKMESKQPLLPWWKPSHLGTLLPLTQGTPTGTLRDCGTKPVLILPPHSLDIS